MVSRSKNQCYENIETDYKHQSKRQRLMRLLLLFIISLSLCILMSFGAYKSSSYALVGEAIFFFVDMTGYLLQLISLCLTSSFKKNTFSFGFQRIEPLGSLLMAIIILLLSIKVLILSLKQSASSLFFVKHNLMLLYGFIAFCSHYLLALILTGKKSKARLLLILLYFSETDESMELNTKETQVKGNCFYSLLLIVFGFIMKFEVFDFFDFLLVCIFTSRNVQMSLLIGNNAINILLNTTPES